MADGIKFAALNTAGQGEKQWLTERYADLLAGKKPEPEETAESIIDRIRAKVEG